MSDYNKLPKVKNQKSRKGEDLFNEISAQFNRSTKTWSQNGYWSNFIQYFEADTQIAWLRTEPPLDLESFKNVKFPHRCKHELCRQVEFAKGAWFEKFIGELILSQPRASSGPFCYGIRPKDALVGQVGAGQEFTYGGRLFEADLIMVVNHCLRYISVTTSSSGETCKGKAFEAMHRAEQIGGGLARYCVISLANNGTVMDCQAEIRTDRPVIFGADDVNEWMGDSVNEPNPASLREFLTT